MLTICCFFIISFSIAQERFIDKKGVLIFEASEQTFEPVKAKNTSVTVILNPKTGEIASLALIKEFRFKNALMEEHFNENYMESDTYPKAIFKGKIVNFNLSELSKKEREFKIIGKIILHGKEKNIESTFFLSKKEQLIYIKGSFIVSPLDFDIKIPKIVRNKIAKQVRVFVNFKLKG